MKDKINYWTLQKQKRTVGGNEWDIPKVTVKSQSCENIKYFPPYFIATERQQQIEVQA